jgi:hypothetical protein
MLGVDLDGTRRIWPAHVACVVGPDASRRIQKDRLDDHRDDQGASDKQSDGKASRSMMACHGAAELPALSSTPLSAAQGSQLS